MIDAALRKSTADLAVDLGTSNTRLALRGRGVVVDQPSVEPFTIEVADAPCPT